MFVLITGSFFEGFKFIGPFVNEAAADAYANMHLNKRQEYWSVPIQKPAQAPAPDTLEPVFFVCQPCDTHFMCGLHYRCRRE